MMNEPYKILDISQPAKEEVYFLSALPIKFMEVAPVRAVLVSFKSRQSEALPC